LRNVRIAAICSGGRRRAARQSRGVRMRGPRPGCALRSASINLPSIFAFRTFESFSRVLFAAEWAGPSSPLPYIVDKKAALAPRSPSSWVKKRLIRQSPIPL